MLAPAAWQRSLADAVTRLDELLELLELDAGTLDPDLAVDTAAARDFPLRVPRAFVARMRPGDPRDPLLLQVLPRAVELVERPGFVTDPLAEEGASKVPGLLHKYRGRVLLVVTGACAVHCRYCFRRHFPYVEHQRARDAWRPALAYVARHPDVEEVILSGGDPLSLTDAKLAALVEALEEIPHLERLRIHTRWPVVLPERVDERLTAWLAATRLATTVMVHVNHPREIDAATGAAFARLRQAGAVLLNQAVLLRGVNDDVETLAELGRRLIKAGVVPHYLHLLDPVAGAAHFEVDEPTAQRLIEDLRGRISGHLVPRLVREVAGAPAKMPVAC